MHLSMHGSFVYSFIFSTMTISDLRLEPPPLSYCCAKRGHKGAPCHPNSSRGDHAGVFECEHLHLSKSRLRTKTAAIKMVLRSQAPNVCLPFPMRCTCVRAAPQSARVFSGFPCSRHACFLRAGPSGGMLHDMSGKMGMILRRPRAPLPRSGSGTLMALDGTFQSSSS